MTKGHRIIVSHLTMEEQSSGLGRSFSLTSSSELKFITDSKRDCEHGSKTEPHVQKILKVTHNTV